MQVRTGEDRKSWFRSDRFYHTDDGWWFQTREHTELGPFNSHKEAESELCLYIRRLNTFHGLVKEESTISKATIDKS